MKIFADCHMHTSFSSDSETPMYQMIESGIEKGLKRMCFTDHLDVDFPISAVFPAGSFLIDKDAYEKEAFENIERYKNKIEVLHGIEVGLQPHLTEDRVLPFATNKFDFIIGSCHVVDHYDICDMPYYEGKTEKEALEQYFADQVRLAEMFHNYDVLGHWDYILRYAPNRDNNFSFSLYADYFDEVIKILLNKGKGIEINTGGLMKGLKEAHPCTDALKRYKELGGEIITVGSDAHTCQNIAGQFDKAAAFLEEAGFKYYTVFKKRKPVFYKLGE